MINYGPYPIALLPKGNGVNLPLLQDQINGLTEIVPHCLVYQEGGNVFVSAKGPIDQAGKAKLDGGVTQVPQVPPLAGSVLGDHDGTPLAPPPVEVSDSGPRTNDGRRILQVNHIPAGHFFWGTGAFDDFNPTPPLTGRGQGDLIAWKTGGAANAIAVREGRFHEYVYILGGSISTKGGEHGDHVSLDVVAPASSPQDRSGTMDGNADKQPIPGVGGMIVPAPGNNGAWNVDGSALEFGQVNEGLVPVPARDANDNPIGFWDWDPDASPSITPNLTQTGEYNLWDVELPLARQANRYPTLVSYQNVTPESAVKGKKILPHWIWRFTLVRGDTPGEVAVAIRLDTARKKTT